ncbi:MAG: hypothetical protein IJW40_01505 [Clostridia bacterium]|nr:hypothetical protein [Clostridia bacterium]
MNDKIKHIVVTATFIVFLAFFVVFCIGGFINPVEKSESERRDLAQLPTDITWESILNTKDAETSTIKQFENFTVDQFPFREWFRSLKANLAMHVFNLNENNGLVIEDGYIAKVESDFNPDLVEYSVGRLQHIYEKYLKDNGGEKFVCLVPDKNYLLARDYGYPSPDYDWMAQTVQSALPGMTYIDIFDKLELSDYYRTDTHWSQDKIGDVVDEISAALGVSDRLSGTYTENSLEDFKGVYYLQSALYPTPDTLVYLTNDVLDACTVYDYETGKTGSIYDFEQFESDDGYNFFLSGTRALLRIDNPNATTDEELIVFRDSFGSSLIPLLAEGYKSIYVVDIRYVMPDMLGGMIDFENKDVLYMYSALVLNQKAFR